MNSLLIEIRDTKGAVLTPVYEVHSLEKALSILNATAELCAEHGSIIEGFRVA